MRFTYGNVWIEPGGERERRGHADEQGVHLRARVRATSVLVQYVM